MPRYLVERNDVDRVPPDAWAEVVATNALHGVTWLHSYVATDRTKTFCIYEAPTPEALRAAARQTKLTIDRIIEVRVLGPYLQV